MTQPKVPNLSFVPKEKCLIKYSRTRVQKSADNYSLRNLSRVPPTPNSLIGHKLWPIILALCMISLHKLTLQIGYFTIYRKYCSEKLIV